VTTRREKEPKSVYFSLLFFPCSVEKLSILEEIPVLTLRHKLKIVSGKLGQENRTISDLHLLFPSKSHIMRGLSTHIKNPRMP
jgi:hypothetical protein